VLKQEACPLPDTTHYVALLSNYISYLCGVSKHKKLVHCRTQTHYVALSNYISYLCGVLKHNKLVH
jgi:hypothetical protein